MKEKQNIDEMLNSFIDDELPERQRVEVQRLASHDSEIAKRLRELEACKSLVGSLPFAEAPAGLLDNVKSLLERKTLLDAQPKHTVKQRGERHLFMRKMLSAAAMFVLIGILSGVVYIIIKPEKAFDKALAGKETLKGSNEFAAMSAEFKGRLVLETNNEAQAADLIAEAIKKNTISLEPTNNGQENKNVFKFACTKKIMNSFFSDLENDWDRLGAAKLYIEIDKENVIKVDKINVNQIAEIMNQSDRPMQIKAAKYYAALNIKSDILTGKDVLAAKENAADLTKIPKPHLTSGDRPVKKAADGEQCEETAHLTITIVKSE